jgi:hypothetical protein
VTAEGAWLVTWNAPDDPGFSTILVFGDNPTGDISSFG